MRESTELMGYCDGLLISTDFQGFEGGLKSCKSRTKKVRPTREWIVNLKWLTDWLVVVELKKSEKRAVEWVFLEDLSGFNANLMDFERVSLHNHPSELWKSHWNDGGGHRKGHFGTRLAKLNSFCTYQTVNSTKTRQLPLFTLLPLLLVNPKAVFNSIEKFCPNFHATCGRTTEIHSTNCDWMWVRAELQNDMALPQLESVEGEFEWICTSRRGGFVVSILGRLFWRASGGQEIMYSYCHYKSVGLLNIAIIKLLRRLKPK